ncbi:hypothetical protein PoB_005005300 [Plakobranchus ocellatus]|uniref:Uncharacterized protein n=1 Tax=Plakobranchus ocellatus TaxID=259542 RepID=A0AAV4BXM1_9GAST|nr:hypothetical protein PoB_005005300 [Plakobranchus ocellatus]
MQRFHLLSRRFCIEHNKWALIVYSYCKTQTFITSDLMELPLPHQNHRHRWKRRGFMRYSPFNSELTSRLRPAWGGQSGCKCRTSTLRLRGGFSWLCDTRHLAITVQIGGQDISSIFY